ncbi:hypothetical protein MU0083_000865 [[Mycobacterium] kokjensenii]|uniref:Uncharacterized protein n=1 Tax=[Mycobacterium] kokjensenii TaxID=3064287 RepID=A0ABM9L8G7_9MYCO|nr:hypothetical protein [Mycolicibacter sp. MU0083]CAJ1494607.1 hypothetical protein MU0083_000865 [Mycolicibacter sp. MU0083]
MWEKGLALAAILVGGAIGLVSPGQPVSLAGSFTMTITDGAGIVRAGAAHTWLLAPCGSDCLNVNDLDVGWSSDAHREGNSWVWTINNGKLTHSFDQRTLAGKLAGEAGTVWWALTKNA